MVAKTRMVKVCIWHDENKKDLLDDCNMKFTISAAKKEALSLAKNGFSVDFDNTWREGDIYMFRQTKDDRADHSKQVRTWLKTEYTIRGEPNGSTENR